MLLIFKVLLLVQEDGLRDLKTCELNKADGILGDAYLDRLDIVRMKPDFSEELIKLNLGKLLTKILIMI